MITVITTAVAPLAGAWIEIYEFQFLRAVHEWSPPSRGRGLKCVNNGLEHLGTLVAPLAGAWIEILTHT